MKKLFLPILMIIGLVAVAQNTSPLCVMNFQKLSNEIADLKELKDDIGRDSDYDGNKAALILVKTQGFSEMALSEFVFYTTSGLQMIHHKIKDGDLWCYVGSNTIGSVVIKYMGDFMFKLPYKLEARGVYELVLGMETAVLTIRAVPADADIYIDNQLIAKGEAIKSLSVGTEHRYRVVREDYYTREGVLQLEKQEERSLKVELEPNFGYITIKSEPSGADVYVDGEEVGVTPYNMKRIKIGRHTVEIKKYGYVAVGDVVTIKSYDHNKLFENVKLEKDARFDHSLIGNKSPITGVFSVSADKKVRIAKGNLQYQASTNTWRFAEHQWDFIGEDNEKISPDYDGWIDLFGWGSGNKPTKVSGNPHDYFPYIDWGNNVVSLSDGNDWRTLKKNEWKYLIDERTTASGGRFAMARVNGVEGVILLPDDWNSRLYALNNVNEDYGGFDGNIISKSDWVNVLEANGAIFLPMAGMRKNSEKRYKKSYGYYWSSTYDNSILSGILSITSDFGVHTSNAVIMDGASVRLVSDVE